MKNLILSVMTIAGLLYACSSDNMKSFIPGIYVDSAASEFSIACDTLIIRKSEGNNYLIERKTGVQYISNGKTGKWEHETEKWNALYDERLKILTETRRGKIISFYPQENRLLVGKREYRKID